MKKNVTIGATIQLKKGEHFRLSKIPKVTQRTLTAVVTNENVVFKVVGENSKKVICSALNLRGISKNFKGFNIPKTAVVNVFRGSIKALSEQSRAFRLNKGFGNVLGV